MKRIRAAALAGTVVATSLLTLATPAEAAYGSRHYFDGGYAQWNPTGDKLYVKDTKADGMPAFVSIDSYRDDEDLCGDARSSGPGNQCNFNFKEGATLRFTNEVWEHHPGEYPTRWVRGHWSGRA